MSIDYENGYSATWRMVLVDTDSWGDSDQIFDLDTFTFNTDGTDDVPLLQSGSAEMTREIGEEFQPGWYRVEMLAQDFSGGIEREAVATLLFEKTSGTINYNYDKAKAKGFSVLKPVSTAKMQAGEWIAKGDDGAAWCASVLSDHTPAPIVVEGSFILDNYYVWDGGTSYLKAVWQVLDAGGFVILIDGDGTIHITPKPSDPALEINAQKSDVLVPGINYDQDFTEVPNVYYAVYGSNLAVATNDDPDSPVSTVTRKWANEMYDDDVMRVGGESLDDYATRRLREESTVFKSWMYEQEYTGPIRPYEIIRFHYPDATHGDFRVLRETYMCTHGILINMELGEEVELWPTS